MMVCQTKRGSTKFEEILEKLSDDDIRKEIGSHTICTISWNSCIQKKGDCTQWV